MASPPETALPRALDPVPWPKAPSCDKATLSSYPAQLPPVILNLHQPYLNQLEWSALTTEELNLNFLAKYTFTSYYPVTSTTCAYLIWLQSFS